MNNALTEHGTSLVPSGERTFVEEGASAGPQVNVLALAWKARWLIVFGALVGGLGAWALLERTTPRYTSVSQVLVEQGVQAVLGAEYAGVAQTGKWLATQASLMRSSEILGNVVRRPEIAELPTITGAGENAIGLVHKELKVTVGQYDDLISVSMELPRGKDAALLVNTVVSEYTAFVKGDHQTKSHDTVTKLQVTKVRLDQELDERRAALDDFRRKHVALSVQVNNDNVINRRFAGLSEELNTTELELLQAKARYNRAMRMYESPQQRPYLMETATSQHSTSRTADLASQVRQLEQQLTAEKASWGDGYPRVRMLKESLDSMKADLAEQQDQVIEAYVDSLRQEYEILTSKRDELQRAFDKQFDLATQVSGQVIELEALEGAVERALKERESIDDKIKRLSLTEEVGGLNVSVVEVAGESKRPSYPSRERFLGAGIALGSLLGFGLAFLRDLLDQRLKSIDEISSALQLPLVGLIPFNGRVASRQDGGMLVAKQPRSPAAEAVRSLRTSVYLGLAAQDSRVFVVTSPAPGDGKSTVASNLAISMAQVGQRVLLIDADMRKPTQHEIFDVENNVGLSSVLASRRPADDAIVPAGVDRLDLLPCGKRPTNPVELLNDGYFASLLDELATRYDRIVIDSPPIMPVADARAIAAMADCTLLVLRAEVSTRRASVSARDELWRVRAQRIGVVVNGVPARKQGAYGYGDSYGYGGYGDVAYGHAEEPDLAPESPRHRGKGEPLSVTASGVDVE
ncbi:MAG: GumC family protein [Lacipirellulaceae bacterium]